MKPRDVYLLVLFLTSLQWCLQSALRAVFLWSRRYHLHHISESLADRHEQGWKLRMASVGQVKQQHPGMLTCTREMEAKGLQLWITKQDHLKTPGGKKGNMPFQPNSHLDDFWQYISICPQNLPRGFYCGWLTPLKTQSAVSLSRHYQ